MSSERPRQRLAELLAASVQPRALVLHEAIAARLGLNATDLLALQVIASEGRVTPGQLAEVVGITTGAVTGVLDRLERAHLLERQPDADDRRRVVVHLAPERLDELIEVLEPLAQRMQELQASYPPADRAVITDHAARLDDLRADAIARLRASTRGGFVDDTYVAPLGSVTRGRLVFVTGAPRLSMNLAPFGPSASARIIVETSSSRLAFEGAAAEDQLLSARFRGPLPDCRVADGTVTVRYRRSAFASYRATLRLNPSIPWSIAVQGGITDLTGAIVAPLASLELTGGANHIKLDLPTPAGSAEVRVTGVVSSATVRRPGDTPVRLRVDGGISHLRLDGERHERIGGRRELQSGDFAGTPDRYTIEVLDGASEVRIGTT